MLSLTRIFLHNWHRFRSTLIDVQDSLYLTGNNGSGKSTILDALQVVLLADLHLIRFNNSAQEKSARTLDGFVRGKIFETRWLRPHDTVGYIAVEFRDDVTGRCITLGCCIEASMHTAPNGTRAYVILKEALDASLFLPQGKALPLFELKKVLQQKRSKAKYYDIIKEYQDDMREVLGGLHPRFFDLFQRALSFKPITRIDDFVKEWLLAESPLDTKNLQQVSQRLDEFRLTADMVEAKLSLLGRIANQEKNYERYLGLQSQYEWLYALLRWEAAKRDCVLKQQQRESLQEQIEIDVHHLVEIEGELEAAKGARTEKEKHLYGLDVVKQRDIWQQEIRRMTGEANSLRKRKQQLIQEMQHIVQALYAANQDQEPLLTTQEQHALSPLIKIVELLTLDQPFSEELLLSVDQALPALSSSLERIGQRLYELTLQSNRLQERATVVSEEMKQLQFHGIVSYPPHVEALRSALEAVVGVRPNILCERIEVPEVRWQMAVESMLGNRRFSILVPPDTYDDVLQFIEQSKADPRFYYARVLDLERVWQQQRPAISQSLALQVSTEDPYVQAYVNSVLGSIITCTSAREVRKYGRAITTDLVYYSEWAVQKLSEKDYVRWFVGRRALDSQIEACERELNQIRDDLLLQATLHSHVKEQKARLDYKDSLSILRPNLENPPEDGYLRLEITDLIEKVQALDLSTAQRLEQEIQNLTDLIVHYEQEKAHSVEEQGRRGATLDVLDKQWKAADAEENERDKEVSAVRERLPEVEELAQALFLEQRKEPDLSQVISNASKAAKSYTTQANDAAQEMRNLRLEYNIKYHFAGLPEIIHDRRYKQEQERLSATELPRYKAQIQQALQEADEELREHILHNLRERIQYAKDELRRMNDALRASVFRGDRYQFCWDIASEMKEYYRLIDDSQLLGTNPLFESTFYEQNRETFDRFYAELMQGSQGDREKQSKATLTDYRTYLTYDLEVTHSDGRVSRLSKIVGETSGGETQTPFYLAIAASFVQLYRMLDLKSSRRLPPTIRLAVFDEAFNRMDEERIGVTLDLFRQFHLQVITATPLERCEYLVPKMCTSLVVTRVGENIVLDDYRNYKAKLEETYGENNA